MSLLNFNPRRYLLFMNDFALLQSLEDTSEDTWRYLKTGTSLLSASDSSSSHSTVRSQSPKPGWAAPGSSHRFPCSHVPDAWTQNYRKSYMRYLWDHIMRKGRIPSVSWDSRACHQHVMHCATHCLTNSGLLDLFHHLTASIHWASYRSDHIRSYQIILSSRSRCQTSVTLKRASGRGLRHAASVFALSWQESMKIMK